MSRSGYSDDNEDPLAHGRWRQAVRRAIEGKRGQALLIELVSTLDAMQDKQLYSGNFASSALGVLGAKRGTKVDDLCGEDKCGPRQVAERFGIAPAMAAEIMYLNDEYLVGEWKWVDVEVRGPIRKGWTDWGRQIKTTRVHNDFHAEERWRLMRNWAAKKCGECT